MNPTSSVREMLDLSLMIPTYFMNKCMFHQGVRCCWLVALVLVTACSAPPESVPEPLPMAEPSAGQEEQIRKAFSAYKEAMLTGNGKEVLEQLDQHTREHYRELMETSKTGDSMRLADLEMIDRLTVLSLRHQAENSKILAMQGDDFLLFAIDSGMIGTQSVSAVELGTLEIHGKGASAEIISRGDPMGMYIHFQQEEGSWKVNILSLMEDTEAIIQKALKDQQMNETEFIARALEGINGQPMAADIWLPLSH